jgi:hypothetical protein
VRASDASKDICLSSVISNDVKPVNFEIISNVRGLIAFDPSGDSRINRRNDDVIPDDSNKWRSLSTVQGWTPDTTWIMVMLILPIVALGKPLIIL